MSSTPRSPQPKPPTNSLTFSNTLTGSYMIPADLFKRAIVEEQNNTIGRCCQRLADTLTIVNDALPDQEKFEITDKEKRRWLTDISIEIAKFQGSMYDQKITTFKIAHEKVYKANTIHIWLSPCLLSLGL